MPVDSVNDLVVIIVIPGNQINATQESCEEGAPFILALTVSCSVATIVRKADSRDFSVTPWRYIRRQSVYIICVYPGDELTKNVYYNCESVNERIRNSS
ncbi:hypothetical protein TNCT_736461 [Trichonephila clavata]|uniref:Uncharacterized protein n=1 Tax=Trichonephila clavata TaxID=2740835 RepID=A0A8X6H1C5_TRICU|nr:hypothetical protein TNCT_736461 [Trichonephila clavata]